LEQVVVPPGVTTIGERAFYNCSSLTQLEIPLGVTTIGHSAFAWCSSLTTMVLPSNIMTLGANVFFGVTKLERLTLVGSPLSPLVVASLEYCFASTAKMFSAALAGQKFGRFTISVPE
jgi:hypothetical protein